MNEIILLLIVILLALAFEFINGFHDTANAIATSVATKVLTARQAIILASITNLIGALMGTEVAKTISSGIVDPSFVTVDLLITVLLAAIIWNLITWWFGLPTSSSHALIGALAGGALAISGDNQSSIYWSIPSDKGWIYNQGIVWKVFVPMIISPLIGFILAYILMRIVFLIIDRLGSKKLEPVMKKIQILSASAMGYMHGTNDAQKTMGIISLALFLTAKKIDLNHLPEWLSFLIPNDQAMIIPLWVKIVCAVIMAAGTSVGGWRIINTLGRKMSRIRPSQGFVAESSAATIIGLSTGLGIPLSTTHNITATILSVSYVRNPRGVRWNIAARIVWAWMLTFPISAGFSYILTKIYLIFN